MKKLIFLITFFIPLLVKAQLSGVTPQFKGNSSSNYLQYNWAGKTSGPDTIYNAKFIRSLLGDTIHFSRRFKGNGTAISPVELSVGDSSATSVNNFAVFRNANGDLVLPNINYSAGPQTVLYNGIKVQSTVAPTGTTDMLRWGDTTIYQKFLTAGSGLSKSGGNIRLGGNFSVAVHLNPNGHLFTIDSLQILNAPVNGNNPLRLKDSALYKIPVSVSNGLIKEGGVIKLGASASDVAAGKFTSDRYINVGNHALIFTGGTNSSVDTIAAIFSKDAIVFSVNDGSSNGSQFSMDASGTSATIGISQGGQATNIGLSNSGINIRDDFDAGMGYHGAYDQIGKSVFGGNYVASARYVDSTAKFKADSVKGTISGGGTTTNPLSLTYGFTGQPLSFDGSSAITGKIDSTVLQTVLNFFPKADTRYYTKTISDGKYALLATTISPGTGLSGGGSLASNRTLSADTTVLQTVLNFFPKGDTRYAKITSLPTGATPTASIGFTAVVGSATSFTRSDGAAKADSTVIRSVANSYSLAGMQTKLNNYALLASPTFTGIPLAPTASFGTNTTQIATTAFVQAAIPSLTGFVPYTGATTDVVLGAHNITAQSEILTGTGGAGIIDMVSQSASPASTSGHLKIYPDSLNRFSYKNSIYRRTFQVPYPSDYTARFPYKVTGTTLEDSTFSATTYAFQSTAINNGYAITGGGNLSASRTLAVDSTLQASKTWAFAAFNTKAQSASTYVPLTRTLTAGTGILTIGDLSANRTISSDTTVLQTVLNFFPKGDTRWLKTTTAASTYLPLTGGTLTNSTAPQLTIAFDGTHTSQFSVNASGMLTISNTSGSISLQTILSNTYRNITAANNAQLSLGTTGTVISRNVADANVALIVNQSNASSTGDVLDLQFNSSNVATLSTAGNLGIIGKATTTQALAASTTGDGFDLVNSTTALTGSLVYNSPYTHYTVQGFASTPAASRSVDLLQSITSAQGTANPSGTFNTTWTVNGSATPGIFSMTSAGVFGLTGGTTTFKQFNTGAGNVDGVVLNVTTAATAGVPSNWATTLTQQGTWWNTSGTPASNVGAMRQGFQPVSGSTFSGIETWAFGSGVSTPSYSAPVMTLTNLGVLNLSGLTASQGVATDASKNLISVNVPITQGTADLTAQTTAGNVTTFTVGASTATFNISGYINITAVTVDVIEMQVTYTDENSTSQTANFFTQGATSALLSAIGNSVYPPMTIRAKNGTVITVKTTLTTGTGSITYDAGARITQL